MNRVIPLYFYVLSKKHTTSIKKVISQKVEGLSTFEALMFIPTDAPFDYYSKDFEKGLQLYSSGVLIMDKYKDLLPDHFSFVRGLVDSADLSLNISRETLQHDRQLRIISKALEKKIAGELKKMLENEREKYEQFFKAFGMQLKWGIYSSYGANKDMLQELILFKSSHEDSYATLKEYASRMKEGQEKIYYASGDTMKKISLLPQVESVIAHGYEVLYLTEDIDEFTLQMLRTYSEKEFLNVCKENLDLSTDEEKEKLRSENKAAEKLFSFMAESLANYVSKVQFTNTLGNHPVSLSSEGNVSLGMEKTFSKMLGMEDQQIKAEIVLEINIDHPISAKLKALFESDRDKVATYSKILLAQA